MADRGALVPADGETRYGTRAISPSGQLWLMVDAPALKVSGIIFQDTAGDSHYLWVDTTGDFRTDTTEPTLPNSDGTVVGSQS